MNSPNAKARVAGVLLAAGASVRFGGDRPKQLAAFGGEPLVRRVARRALESGLDELILVVGHAAKAVSEAVEGLSLEIVENADWARGQGTSVAAGVGAVGEDCDAALFLSTDQPFLDAGVLNRLLDAFSETGGPIVVPTLRGQRVAPVVFSRSLFPDLSRLRGDVGGRQLFARHSDEIVEVRFTAERPFEDLDTPEDLRRLRS